MPTALEQFQIQQQLADLLNSFNQNAISNAFQRQALSLNRDAVLGDLQRNFDRSVPFLGVPTSRRGLETSGLRNQQIDRSLGDFQRNFQRANTDFTRQFNQLDVADLQNQTTFSQGNANLDAFQAARRSEIASQIQSL